ncbi:MAG: phosphoribosylanthranilate isomerase [Candidatus Omnitrophica bacterium]|nr:phosphoribosylanthranilate isomerase [Candidatus Omnitrophota bacterium]
MSVRVKICGITNKDDAFKAIKFGADALGFVFYKKSPRYVSPSRARNIVEILPPFVSVVGVFVDEKIGAIRDIAGFVGLNAIQLHGEEDHHFCHRLKRYQVLRIIKGFRVNEAFDFAAVKKFDVDGYLFDTYQEGVAGGTGKVFNWELLKRAEVPGPVILSGGLTPENVQEAVRTVKPFAVDVSSGVEATPGQKDHHKLQTFILNVNQP